MSSAKYQIEFFGKKVNAFVTFKYQENPNGEHISNIIFRDAITGKLIISELVKGIYETMPVITIQKNIEMLFFNLMREYIGRIK